MLRLLHPSMDVARLSPTTSREGRVRYGPPSRQGVESNLSDRNAPATAWQLRREPPRTMRAVVLTGHGDPERLELREDWPLPRSDGPGARSGWAPAGSTTPTSIRVAYSAGASDATTAESSPGASRGRGVERAGDLLPQDSGGGRLRNRRRRRRRSRGVASRAAGARRSVAHWSAPHEYGYFGSECDGGFAEYVAVPSPNVHVVESACRASRPSRPRG